MRRGGDSFDSGGKVVWQPTPRIVEGSHLKHFMDRHGIATLEELQLRSTREIEWFWNAVLKDLDIRFSRPYSKVVDLSGGIEWPRWCVGGRLNIVGNLLDKYAGTATDARIAVKAEREDGTVQELSYAELRKRVAAMAGGLRGLGLGQRDAVGVFMPMTAEAVIAMLAIIRIGGIFVPLFSGYGAGAVAARLADAEAKALFTADGCWRRGKFIAMKAVADAAVEQANCVKNVIVLKQSNEAMPWTSGRDVKWDELMKSAPAATVEMEAEDPLMLIYTSGTTGKPKGAVHTHCGFPIKSAQDVRQCMDLHEDETLYWMSDMGWMMGPWLVFGVLLNGATMMVYDGAADFPDVDRVWDLCRKHGVTMLGISPTLVRSLMKFGAGPARRHDLSRLRKFASTGEPWNPEPWMWLFEEVGGGRLPILNYSGGTEISGGILCGNMLQGLKPCGFSGPVPGMAADVVDESGRSVRGQVGELVIRGPWIGMTRGFWKDAARYIQTYWSRWPGVWAHGDWAAVDDEGTWYILGRSDDTIKVAGKRLGPAEVESILVGHPAVAEAAAIGVPDAVKGQALVCFCVLKPGQAGDESLRKELADKIVGELGKALSAREIRFVDDLPKTRNAKVMRRVIRAAYLGEEPGDVSALENPGAVDAIRKSK